MKEILNEVIKEVREEYINRQKCRYSCEEDWEYFTGSCGELAKMVIEALGRIGYTAISKHGDYHCKQNDIGVTPHWWVVIGDFIVDAGIDQFETNPFFIRAANDERYVADED